MNKKKYILTALSLIAVALITSACKQTKQEKSDKIGNSSGISASETETSKENSGDFSQFTEEESNSEASRENTASKAENKSASDNKSAADNKGTSAKDTADNNGTADSKDTSDNSSSADNKDQNSGDKASQPTGGMNVASDTAADFGPLF